MYPETKGVCLANVYRLLIPGLLILMLAVSCSTRDAPIIPQPLPDLGRMTDPGCGSVALNPAQHMPWGMKLVYVNPSTCEFQEVSLRQAAAHMNIIQFLEVSPCQDCLSITSIQPGSPGTLLIELRITHPFPDPYYTAFDVRAIFMFNGSYVFPESGFTIADRIESGMCLANPDGYTTLYNPETAGHGLEGWLRGRYATYELPNCRLNPYIRLFTDDSSNTRNAFYAGTTLDFSCTFRKPQSPFTFAYAVDACWAKPVNQPVQDPMIDFGPNANCPESWKIEISETPIDAGLNDLGGEAVLTIDVYDWQGSDMTHRPTIECPEVFDGEIEAEWIADFNGFSRYEATVTNSKLAQVGLYPCLVSKEAGENDQSSSWLDLTAYEIYFLRVNHPFNPIDLTPDFLNFEAVDSVVDGNYAYISCGKAGLVIYDITDPSAPVLAGGVEFEEEIGNIDFRDGYVYACPRNYYIAVVDVDPPESASIVHTVETIKEPQDVTIAGEYACVVTSERSSDYLEIIDITNPEDAVRISATVMQEPELIVSENDSLYVIANGDLVIWDISDPYNPVSTDVIDLPGENIYQISVSNGILCIAMSKKGVFIVDVSTPGDAGILHLIELDYGIGVAAAGELLYYTDHSSAEGTLYIADISDPATPVELYTYPGYGGTIQVNSGRAFFSAMDYIIADIAIPEAVTSLGIIHCTTRLEQLYIRDGYCYATSNNNELSAFDIEPPESTHLVANVDIPQQSRAIDIEGNLMFVAMGPYDYCVLDITDPESPVMLGTVDADIYALDVDVVGNIMYTASIGLGIYDVSDPLSPVEIAVVETSMGISDIFWRDGLVYAASFGPYFWIFDASDPYSPSLVTEVLLPADGEYLSVEGGYAIVTHADGLNFLDIDPPDEAFIVSGIDDEDIRFRNLATQDGYAYAASDPVRIFDMRPPWVGEVVYAFDTGFGSPDIAVDGNLFYACYTDGLYIGRLW